jgi:hypothetical protein
MRFERRPELLRVEVNDLAQLIPGHVPITHRVCHGGDQVPNPRQFVRCHWWFGWAFPNEFDERCQWGGTGRNADVWTRFRPGFALKLVKAEAVISCSNR